MVAAAEAYWAVDPTAECGTWEKASGLELLTALRDRLGTLTVNTSPNPNAFP